MMKIFSFLMILVLLIILGCATDLRPNNSNLETEKTETLDKR